MIDLEKLRAEAYMPFGAMELAYAAMLAAAQKEIK